ncbi:TadE/TadG family type IV pilus assembly protein [Nocardioides sambongensis]|uniref:TadE/TadG family type IV pilus assembly protein n=1 Tax=Nocardioides sambongensis TaxID=2589074 RepID=UPI0011294A67|nr:TadE/TadG family type IV pilus assembly protein [Nocardioides sambongensis]
MAAPVRDPARRRAPGRTPRGAAAVEFALVLPVLLVLVFGIINFGDMLSVRQGVSQAAAEGARAAAVTPGSTETKRAAAKAAVADALGAHGETCSAECSFEIERCTSGADPDPDDPGGTPDCAYVEVVIAYDALIPGFGAVLPETLSYEAVARVS